MLKCATVLLILATATLAPGAAGLQSAASVTRPNFSGTWAVVPGPPTRQPAANNWTSPVTIRHDTRTLTVDYVSRSRSHAPVKLVYDLDGSAGKGVDPNGTPPHNLLLRAEWRGTRLALNTTYLRASDGNIEITDVLAQDSPTTMTVESIRKVGNQTLTSTSTWQR